eukprot:20185-Heterococcus_DN1.PRE.3
MPSKVGATSSAAVEDAHKRDIEASALVDEIGSRIRPRKSSRSPEPSRNRADSKTPGADDDAAAPEADAVLAMDRHKTHHIMLSSYTSTPLDLQEFTYFNCNIMFAASPLNFVMLRMSYMSLFTALNMVVVSTLVAAAYCLRVCWEMCAQHSLVQALLEALQLYCLCGTTFLSGDAHYLLILLSQWY